MDDLPTPPTSPVGNVPAPQKPLHILLVALGVVAILGLALWFGSKFYYQVSPLDQVGSIATTTGEMLCDLSQAPHCLPFKQALDSSAVSVHLPDQCGYFSVVDASGKLSTTTLKRIGGDLCRRVVEKGGLTIEQPTAVPWGAISLNGEHHGVGIITTDRTYLVSFLLQLDDNGRYSLYPTRFVLLKESKSHALNFMQIGDPNLRLFVLRITGTNASGAATEEYWAENVSRDTDASYSISLTHNTDGTFSRNVFNDYYFQPLRAAFSVPFPGPVINGVREFYGDRDMNIELQNNTKPIYHPERCGFEQAYADTGFWADPATIYVHFGVSPTIYLTTPRDGYAPELWGKIVGQLSVESFRAKVMEAGSVSGSHVEILDIAGYRVKHVGPILPDRTCYQGANASVTYDMYQAIKNGAVITVSIRNDGQARVTEEYVQSLLRDVFTTFTATAP